MAADPFLALVIELYLPPSVSGEEVVRIAEDAYRPLLRLLEAHRDRAAVTIAIDPALTMQLLRQGQGGILHGLASLAERGSAELAAGSKNHALLPRIPRREVERQIQLGNELMKETLGWAWRPRGLFSPALAYGRQVAEVAAAKGFKWLLLDEICLGRLGDVPTNKIPVARLDRELCLFFQSRRAADLFVSTGVKRLSRILGMDLDGGYCVAVVPAEAMTSGSHALGNLDWAVSRKGLTLSTLSSLLALFPDRTKVEPLPGSRRTSPEHLAMGIPFAPWSSPDNEVQAFLWHLSSIGWTEAKRLDEEAPNSHERSRLRSLVDEGLHSAAFRQASFGEEWDPEAVLRAGRRLALAVAAGGSLVSTKTHACAEDLMRGLEAAVRARC